MHVDRPNLRCRASGDRRAEGQPAIIGALDLGDGWFESPVPHIHRDVPEKFLPLPVIHDDASGTVADRIFLE